MHSTKTEILALLKRSDGATVDELASSLGLAPMTVRQHLTALERDGLIRAREVRRATGRPHYRYSLTDGGHRRVAQGYDRLVALLIEAAGAPAALDGATPGERRGRLFREAALALAKKHRGEVLMLSGGQRVARAVEILLAHGGFAEWHELRGAWEVRDFSCVYRASVDGCGPCQWHEPFLAALLGGPIEAAPPSGDCAACCRYLIPTPAGSPAATLALRGEESRSTP